MVRRFSFALAVIVIASLVALGCGGSVSAPSSPTPVPTPPATPAPVTFSVRVFGQSNLTAGSITQFQTDAYYSDGRITNVTKDTTWSSSAPDVASVSLVGSVTAVKPGSSQINANYQGVLGAMSVSVTPPDSSITELPLGSVSASGLPAHDSTALNIPFATVPGFVDGPGTVVASGLLTTAPSGLSCPDVQWGVFASIGEANTYANSRSCASTVGAHFATMQGLILLMVNNTGSPVSFAGVSLTYVKDK